MPFTPSTPESEQVQATVEKALTVFHLHEVKINHAPDGPNRVQISWSKGFMDGDTYVVATMHKSVISDETLATAMAAQVTAGASNYDQIKNAAWWMLQTDGALPDGSIG
jgi:hypothetical protein